LLRGALVDVGDQNFCALGREHLSDASTDALARSGDDGRFALQPVSHVLPPRIDAGACRAAACSAFRCTNATATRKFQRRRRCGRPAFEASQAMVPMVLRKRPRVYANRTAPISANARNCGHTTSKPAPRNRIAWPSITKCVVG